MASRCLLAWVFVSALAASSSALAAGVTLQVQHKETIGRYLTDGQGMTLYRFAADGPGRSTCRVSCLNTWMPVITHADPVPHKDVDPAMLSTMERASGARHVTYDGWPLYRYAGDEQPGDTQGHGIQDFGARWYVVSPGGSRDAAAPAD
jgi:predicted lipoprotein with Yx(FWY)xxD motif